MGGTKIGEAQTFAESAFEAGCFSRRWCQLEDFETGNEDRTRDAQFDVDWLMMNLNSQFERAVSRTICGSLLIGAAAAVACEYTPGCAALFHHHVDCQVVHRLVSEPH